MTRLILDDLGGSTGHKPGDLCTVICVNPKTDKRSKDKLEWGLLPHNAKDPLTELRPTQARAVRKTSYFGAVATKIWCRKMKLNIARKIRSNILFLSASST